MTPQWITEQVDSARTGNREAFADLVAHYQGLVSATTLNIVGDFQQSEDLAQEAFLIAWNQLAELSDPKKFPAWICGIARNCSNNFLRREKRNPIARSVELSETTEPPVVESDATKTESEAQLVWRSLAEIPELYREPMLMFYRHGAKIEEIADALELSEETVRQRLSRGRKLLKSEVERTIEKTLSATRPDTAFTLAILAAIPLSAATGCSATSKSLGMIGGISAMSGYGILGVVFGFFMFFFLSSFTAVLLAAFCLFAFWTAVKNSPTLRTRRFAISVALDVCVLFWLNVHIPWLIAKLLPKTGSSLLADLTFFMRHLPISLQQFLFGGLPVFLVFSTFVVYVVLRWRQILAEDCSVSREAAKTQAVGQPPGEENPLAKVFENELTFFRRTVDGYRNFCLTSRGLCVKRNIVFVLVAVLQLWYVARIFSFNYTILKQAEAMSLSDYTMVLGSLGLSILIIVLFQVLFFRFVSRGIGISRDETDLEQTPPSIPMNDWNADEYSPKTIRRIFIDAVFLLIAIPFALLMTNLAGNFAQEIFVKQQLVHVPIAASPWLYTILEIEIALAVSTALWLSRNSAKRSIGIPVLFVVCGFLTFIFIEKDFFITVAAQFYLGDFCSWLDGGKPRYAPGLMEYLKSMLSWHLTAVVFLVYSLLAAAFSYFAIPRDSEH